MTLQAYAPLPDETVVAAAETVVAEPALTERVAKMVAGVGLVGYARAALEHAGHAATISGNRITVDHEVEAQLVSANGHSWWNVYFSDGTPPVWTVGTQAGPFDRAGAS